jgi:hypothetical protein
VRAQDGVVLPEEPRHPAGVLLHRRLPEHRDRQRQVLAQQVPALVRDVADPERRRAAGASAKPRTASIVGERVAALAQQVLS